jgi:flagellar motor switch protein FliN/FliY
MSDGMLSQDELDALLSGMAEGPEEAAPPAEAAERAAEAATPPSGGGALSAAEMDALGEIGNISMGAAATVLSTILTKKVEITTPQVSVVPSADFQKEYSGQHVVVEVAYISGFEGSNVLILKDRDAALIADLMMGGDGTSLPEELNEFYLSAVSEVMNQMMGASSTSISTIFNKKIELHPPKADLLDLSDKSVQLPFIKGHDFIVKVNFRMAIEGLIDSNIVQLIPLEFGRLMAAELLKSGAVAEGRAEKRPAVPEEVGVGPAPSRPSPAQPRGGPPSATQAGGPPRGPVAGGPAADRSPSPPTYPPPGGGSAPPTGPGGGYPYGAGSPMMMQPQPTYQQPYQQPMGVQPVQFAPLGPSEGVESNNNLGLLMDVPMEVTVELGKTKKLVKEILELGSGSIIELDKLAGEPVDLLVNGKLIAHGEVVVIEENFGIRVTDIVSPMDRLGGLG